MRAALLRGGDARRVKLHVVALLLLLLVAFGLRLFRLDAQSLWWDEGISLHLATSSLPEIVADRINNIHPPLYFFLLKGWIALVGVTPFAARYLSLLASWLQVAAVYALLRRWFGLRVAMTGALLAAISVVSVIYAQEVRVYALLPLVYLGLLGLTQALLHATTPPPSRRWIALGVVAWIGLHLHYIVAFAVAYVALWALLVFLRQRRWRELGQLTATYALVGLASLPWFVAVVANWTAVQAEANAGTFVTDPAPLRFLLAQVWVFHLTGLPGALSRPLVVWLAGGTAVLLSLLFLWRLAQRRARRASVGLLAHWLLPLASALIVWSVRSFSHPRYVAAYVVGLLLLVAFLAAAADHRIAIGRTWRRTVRQGLAVLLLLGVGASSLLGLGLYFFDSAVAKDDIRGVARYLQAEATAADVVFVPDTDWSLPFEYEGVAPVVMPGVDVRVAMWPALAEATADRRRAFLLDYARGTRDWQRVVPFALEGAGQLVAEEAFDGVTLRTYVLDTAVAPPQLAPQNGRIGPLQLVGVWLEQDAAADSAVTLALRWRLVETTAVRLQSGLRLLDAAGHAVATADDALLDENGRPTEQWRPGQVVTTYHVLPVQPGTPPLRYRAMLSLYAPEAEGVSVLDVLDAQGAPQGQRLALGDVALAPAREPGSNPYGLETLPRLPQPVVLAPGLRLLAATPPAARVAPGQPLPVALLWQATQEGLPDWRPALRLVQDGVDIAAAPPALLGGRYPTSGWRSGEIVREQRQVTVPTDATGTAVLTLELEGNEFVLGEVAIEATERRFAPPAVETPLDVTFGDVARLVGYDLPADVVTAADTVPVTLYWQALSGDVATDYTVFAHLLDSDGRLIGQHDAPPANGKRPTRGWTAGEYIIDPHEMVFRESDYAGSAQIEVGLYDPETGERLVTAAGDDRVLLPVTITVRPQP